MRILVSVLAYALILAHGMQVGNFGVNHDRISKEPKYSLSGRPVLKHEAMGEILADDSGKRRVTVIGKKDDRVSVLRTLEKLDTSSVLIKAYDPSHWYVKEKGFRTDGNPTVYVQAPDGTVLFRFDGLPEPKSLAAALTEVPRTPVDWVGIAEAHWPAGMLALCVFCLYVYRRVQ